MRVLVLERLAEPSIRTEGLHATTTKGLLMAEAPRKTFVSCTAPGMAAGAGGALRSARRQGHKVFTPTLTGLGERSTY